MRATANIPDNLADTSGSLPTIFVVPLTTNTRAGRYPGTFEVEPSGTNGLPVGPSSWYSNFARLIALGLESASDPWNQKT